MLHSHPNTLHVTRLSQGALTQLSPSFAQLPHTDHADGQYRLRRYSVVRFINGAVEPLENRQFVQSADINRFQGDVLRQFEPLLPATLSCDGMREMCELFVEANQLPDGQEIEIHQIRIAAIYDQTEVAPEGVHQDGFEHIAMIGIDRHNISGGDIMLYERANDAPFYRKVLDNGEVAILADNQLWHNACPIQAVQPQQQGHMDLFVLTAKGARHEFHA